MCYRNIFRKLSILLLTMIMINYSSFAFASDTSEFVLTITSPVAEGVNGSKVLFNKLKKMIGEVAKNDSFASIIDKVGGNWSLTCEMSCVQFSILFPEENDSVIARIHNFVSKISQLNVLLANDGDRSAFSAIFSNCATKCDWNWNESISFYANGLPKSFSNGLTTLLASSTYKSDLFSNDKKWLNSLAVKDVKPMSSSILSWDKISIQNYISAKFIGEKFLKTSSDTELAEYRIWNLPGKLFLILSIKGSERVLYDNLQNRIRFCNSLKNSNIGKSDDWQSFSSSSKKILTEDRRDPMKSALYKGWTRHWTNENDEISNEIIDEIEFVAPSEMQYVFIMPHLSMHEISYSDNRTIGFVGHKYKGSKELIDVVLAIKSEKISDVKKAFDSTDKLAVPVTLKEVRDDLLLVAFCVDANVYANINANATDNADTEVNTMNAMMQSLYKRVNHLKLTSDTSLALVAVGQLAPFILKYKLQSNWKSLEQEHSWEDASEEDIANALGLTTADPKALSGKYLLKIASSRGRAELLAILACHHKKLNSFTKHFK